MKAAHDIIIKPLVTERSGYDQVNGRYTFIVDRHATKPEIARAVEQLFDVQVLKVNTSKIPGKVKRVRVQQGKTAERKKAIVKIAMEPKDRTYTDKAGKEKTSGKKYKNTIENFGFAQ